MKRNLISSDVLETVDESGNPILYEKYENTVRVGDIENDSTLKLNCQACEKFGKNLACPPYSPEFHGHIGALTTARVIAVRIPLEQLNHIIIGEERYRKAYQMAGDILRDELLKRRHSGKIVAGSGACHGCKECAIESGNKECANPDHRIYSLESLGVNVVGLYETAFGMSLSWSADEQTAEDVCAVGAWFE